MVFVTAERKQGRCVAGYARKQFCEIRVRRGVPAHDLETVLLNRVQISSNSRGVRSRHRLPSDHVWPLRRGARCAQGPLFAARGEYLPGEELQG